MKKLLTIMLNAAVLISFAAPTDTIPPIMPPRPPQNAHLAPHIHLNRNEQLTLTNLVIFIRFADDEEFTESLAPIDQMFNDTTPDAISVHNYYNATTYGKINYNTVYTNNIQDTVIVSYQDSYPRSYFQPQSSDNPDGYTNSVTREFEMLARALRYVDSLNLVDSTVNLDGNHDGLIDNISFILKGNVGNWNDLLWPHMNYFSASYAGLSNEIYINGKLPCSYNFEFADSGPYFTTNVFCHEMGHSLGIPDYYHYYDYLNVYPVYLWDMMGQNNLQQISTIIKYKYLGIVDEPVEIVEDGHYVLNSNSSSDQGNCYFIRSSIDPDQWFTIEYRNSNDFMENVPHSGVIIGRWYDRVDLDDLFDGGNGHFDFFEKPHTYWVFRRNSSIDTINGSVTNAAFGYGNRTAFGPTTNPHPYLVDGTPETSFEITNIQFNGDQASFDVHFLETGIPSHGSHNGHIYPNPVNHELTITLDETKRVEIYDQLGKLLLSETNPNAKINVSMLPKGIYIVKITTADGCYTEKFIKQ